MTERVDFKRRKLKRELDKILDNVLEANQVDKAAFYESVLDDLVEIFVDGFNKDKWRRFQKEWEVFFSVVEDHKRGKGDEVLMVGLMSQVEAAVVAYYEQKKREKSEGKIYADGEADKGVDSGNVVSLDSRRK